MWYPNGARAFLPPLLLASSMVVSADDAVSNTELKKQVDTLQRQVTELMQALQEKSSAPTPVPSANAQAAAKPEPKKTGTTVKIGGYIKWDSSFSDYSDGSSATAGIGEDFLVASTIPVGGESGDAKFNSHAKSSRFFIKTHTPTDSGAVDTYMEFDAIGSSQGDERISNSYAERIRHAYVAWQVDSNNILLAGQTWSTFFNVGTLPELLDFVGPVGIIFERQPQLRYTRKLHRGSFDIAAENPATTLYNGTENPYDDSSVPDIVARYSSTAGNFSYSAAVMARQLRYENGAMDADANGYAVSVAGKYQLGRDDIRFMLNYGNALGRYMGLNGFRSGQIESDGEIELIDQLGGFVALRHFWSDRWRSNLILSASRADNPDTVADTTPSDYQSLHFNVLYSPVTNLTLGGEAIFASKELENVSGALADDEGNVKRLQLSVKYAF